MLVTFAINTSLLPEKGSTIMSCYSIVDTYIDEKGNLSEYEQKRKQVYEVLITPIKCIKYSKGKASIVKRGNLIETTQTYYPYKNRDIRLDEDMSDFAVGFYKILYKSLLPRNRILKDNDALVDKNFAGDTMNSFNNIANLFPEAGLCKNKRTPKCQWRPILQEWKQQYHCLANFWIIPLEIGRKNDSKFSKGSCKNGLCDFVDRFLKLISMSDNFNVVFSGTYKDFNEFAEMHFLIGSYIKEDLSIISFSDETEDPEKMIEHIFNCIKLRAKTIANSDCALELWNYFNKWELF